jgi:hypothetical protein
MYSPGSAKPGRLSWQGRLLSIQPRIRLTRSFDERSHTYLGYALRFQGTIAEERREFLVGVGKGAHAKHQFQAGDIVSGMSDPVADARIEPVEFYKTSGLKILERAEPHVKPPPPWLGVPPELETYRARGHRRLDAKTYEARCPCCLWGCKMAVEMIIDQWNPSVRRYRYETFCYGPKSCSLYRAGPTRKAPGRKGMTWEETDWIDGEATGHRGMDE